MSNRNAVIIGGGISGLALGCYLQKSGFITEIHEANAMTGGLCSGFEQNGYLIDGGLKSLWGSGKEHPFYKLFCELIDMQNIKILNQDIKTIYDFPDGEQFIEYADLGALEKEMLKAAPVDEVEIKEWIADIRKLSKIKPIIEKPKELYGLSDRLRAGKSAGAAILKKWGAISAGEFSERFKNPLLKKAIACFESPVLEEMIKLAALDLKSNGYPEGGSRAIARELEEKYLALGGKVHTKSRAQKIQVEKRKAVGVLFDDGRKVFGDIIVSAMDGRTTLFDLLGGKFINPEIRQFYEKPDVGPSVVQVSIGVDRTFAEDFPARKVILQWPYELPDGSVHSYIEVMRFTQRAGGKEKTLFRTQMQTKFAAYWWLLRNAEKDRYIKEKAEIAEWVAGVIDERLCPIAGAVEMTHVTTPATYIRRTGNWRGSVAGWGSGNVFMENPFERSLPGLENFYMTGHWVQQGGGIPLALKSARDLAQVICKKEKKEFRP